MATWLMIGDSVGGDWNYVPKYNEYWEYYGFGGFRNTQNNYSGIIITAESSTTIVDDRTKWFLPYRQFGAGAKLEFNVDTWNFPQVRPGYTYNYSPLKLHGVQVIWPKGAGILRIQYAAYDYYGSANYNYPTWTDAAEVDTDATSAPIGFTTVIFPTDGLYRVRLAQVDGTPGVLNLTILGRNGLLLDGSIARGGDYIEHYVQTPEAVWATFLNETKPDLVTIAFKNNSAATPAAWEACLRVVLGYLRTYAPHADVVLMGTYNSQWDDSYVGTAQTMPQRRAMVQAIAAEPDTLHKVYFDETILGAPGGTYADAATRGFMADAVHASDAGKAFLATEFADRFDLMTLPTSTPSPTPTPEPTPEPTPSPTPEPTPSPTPEPTPSPTPEPTPSPTPEPTPSPTPEPTPSPPPEPTPSPTPEPTPSPTPTPARKPYISLKKNLVVTSYDFANVAGGSSAVNSVLWQVAGKGQKSIVRVDRSGNWNVRVEGLKGTLTLIQITGLGERGAHTATHVIRVLRRVASHGK